MNRMQMYLCIDTMEYWENENRFTQSAVWAKVVKRQLIVDHNLLFEKGIRNEDTEWTAKMLLCAESYDWYEKVFYVYRKGTGEAQTDKRVTFKEVNDLKNILDKYITLADTIENSDFQKVFKSYLAFPYAVLMGQVQVLNNEEKKKIGMSTIKRYSTILNYDMDPTVSSSARGSPFSAERVRPAAYILRVASASGERKLHGQKRYWDII